MLKPSFFHYHHPYIFPKNLGSYEEKSYLCRRKAALGKLKASFLCARLHFLCSDKYNIYIFMIMRTGDKVLISPDLTHAKDWTQGEVIEVENNPFVGIVISAKTADGNIFFGYKDLFEPAKEAVCTH